MIRVKDPKVSLDFYENVLGMDLIDKLDMSDFTLYFLGYQHQGDASRGEREALLELTHNHGTENDPDFHYHNGNAQPHGFGHLAISVDDIEAACARFERLGVKFQKRLTGMYSPLLTCRREDEVNRYVYHAYWAAFILDPGTYKGATHSQTTTGSRSFRPSVLNNCTELGVKTKCLRSIHYLHRPNLYKYIGRRSQIRARNMKT